MNRSVWVLLAFACVAPMMGASDKNDAKNGAKEGDNVGWHGEQLPAGLELGTVNGEYIFNRDQSVMVYVPGGPFTQGSMDGERDERPVRKVSLDAYYIDKYEVSWRQWKLSGLPYDPDNPHSRYPLPRAPDWGIHDDHPVVSMTWDEAQTYAKWVGKHLPSEAEWEKAARGTDSRTYPWGEEPPSFDHAVWEDHPIAKESTAAVDCCPKGASPYGAMNLAGNVYEWCEDAYHPAAYERLPAHNPVQQEGRYRVLRGGAFPFDGQYLRTTSRHRLYPNDRGPYIGFRTVLRAP